MKFIHPSEYQTRTVRRFLWLPVTIGKETRWLEKATWTEQYMRYIDGTFGWVPQSWEN